MDTPLSRPGRSGARRSTATRSRSSSARPRSSISTRSPMPACSSQERLRRQLRTALRRVTEQAGALTVGGLAHGGADRGRGARRRGRAAARHLSVGKAVTDAGESCHRLVLSGHKRGATKGRCRARPTTIGRSTTLSHANRPITSTGSLPGSPGPRVARSAGPNSWLRASLKASSIGALGRGICSL